MTPEARRPLPRAPSPTVRPGDHCILLLTAYQGAMLAPVIGKIVSLDARGIRVALLDPADPAAPWDRWLPWAMIRGAYLGTPPMHSPKELDTALVQRITAEEFELTVPTEAMGSTNGRPGPGDGVRAIEDMDALLASGVEYGVDDEDEDEEARL